MKVFAVAFLLAFGAGISQSATIKDGNLSLNLSFSGEGHDGETFATGPLKAKISVSEVIDITALEEGALNENTTISVTGIIGDPIEFQLGDDPNYQTGDSSAKVTLTDVQGGFGAGTNMNVNAQVTLKNGDMVLSLQVQISGNLDQPVGPKPSAAKVIKDAEPAEITTIVTNPGPAEVFNLPVGFVNDTHTKEDIFKLATGETRIKISASIKSRYID